MIYDCQFETVAIGVGILVYLWVETGKEEVIDVSRHPEYPK